MLMKLKLHVKLIKRIPSKLFTNSRIKIHNNKSMCAGGVSQQVADMISKSLSTLFLKDHLRIFTETNKCVSINYNPLVKKEKNVNFNLCCRYLLHFIPI